MHTKAGFSLVPVPGYLPNSNDLEQRNADQISQIACHEVNTITREMQVIMQGDNKHPHVNKTGSFSCLWSFELNNMGFSLSKISPITFDMDNPQTPADCVIKSRAPTSTPQERWTPQAHSEPADLNEAHHEPRGDASYNPDESITNKNVQGRVVPPRTDNKATQPQQSLSEEGSKECTILQGPHVTSHKEQPLQHLHGLEDHHRLPHSLNQVQASRIHWNTMTPMDPPKHLQTTRAQVLANQRRHRQMWMGFSLSKISPITFDMDNPQTPADCGIKSRAPTSTPQERWTPQAHSEPADLNEAHHEPRGDASYNPDESITNKNVQGRVVPPRTDNKATQPQQSLSEEGSKECTILNGPAIDSEKSAQGHPSRATCNKPQGAAPCSTYNMGWRTTTGSPTL